MIGYAEVLQTMAAMVIFSVILLNGNRLIQRNTVIQIEGEMEQETIALAQDIIEESRTKEFDENSSGSLPPVNIPGDFTSPSTLGPEGGTAEDERHEFNDFDDYHGWSQTLTTEQGDFQVSCEVFYVDDTNYEKTSTRTTFKKIVVTIKNDFLKNSDEILNAYTFEFIRNFYAD